MYVCVCNAVTERHITQAVQQGARHLRDLRTLLGVAAECGKCAGCARNCLKGELAPAPIGQTPHEFQLMAAEAQ